VGAQTNVRTSSARMMAIDAATRSKCLIGFFSLRRLRAGKFVYWMRAPEIREPLIRTVLAPGSAAPAWDTVTV
jgi:hypothetical protein